VRHCVCVRARACARPHPPRPGRPGRAGGNPATRGRGREGDAHHERRGVGAHRGSFPPPICGSNAVEYTGNTAPICGLRYTPPIAALREAALEGRSARGTSNALRARAARAHADRRCCRALLVCMLTAVSGLHTAVSIHTIQRMHRCIRAARV
jgi:hypothetical protein